MREQYISEKVTIGMPIYDGMPFVCQALDSLLAQNYENFELIISDNASTDESREICIDYANRDKRIHYYRNDVNRGPLWNFNRVLDLSKSEYFMWAAHDDLWEPTYISILKGLLSANPDAVLAFSALSSINEHGDKLRTYPHILALPSDRPSDRLRNYLSQDGYLGKANLIYGLMRRQTIEEAGGFKLWGGTWGADMLVVFRLLSLGRLVLTPEILFHKRLVYPTLSQTEPPTPTHIPWYQAIAQRFTALQDSVQDQHCYFRGYGRIIDIAGSLSIQERTKLKVVLCEQAMMTYLRNTRTMLVAPIISSVPSATRTLGRKIGRGALRIMRMRE